MIFVNFVQMCHFQRKIDIWLKKWINIQKVFEKYLKSICIKSKYFIQLQIQILFFGGIQIQIQILICNFICICFQIQVSIWTHPWFQHSMSKIISVNYEIFARKVSEKSGIFFFHRSCGNPGSGRGWGNSSGAVMGVGNFFRIK